MRTSTEILAVTFTCGIVTGVLVLTGVVGGSFILASWLGVLMVAALLGYFVNVREEEAKRRNDPCLRFGHERDYLGECVRDCGN